MKYPAYPKYKSSGVEWLGDVPEHWSVKQIKFIIKHIKIGPFGSDLTLDMMTDDGIKVYGQENLINDDFSLGDKFISELKYEEMKIYTVEKDDILISMMGTIGKCRVVPRNIKKGIINSHLIKIKVNQMLINPNYLSKVINGSDYVDYEINRKSVGTIMSGLNSSIVKSLSILLPPLPEQQAIADFLDREMGRVDTLIDKKQKFIDLLKEKRTALISQAVTKGLNPNVKMKPSGVEWLGDVPEHWEVKRLKFAIWLSRGVDLPTETFVEGPYPVYASNGLIGYHNVYTTKGPCVVVGRSGSVGEVNYVEGDFWAHNTALYIQEFRKVLPRFSYYLLLVMDLKSLSAGSAVGTLNRNYIHDVSIAVPSLLEQQAIADYLDDETDKIDSLIAKVDVAIEKLKEYRTAIISAAVTGKINVSTNLNTGSREVA